MSAGATTAGRTARQLLSDRNFGPFVLGKILSSCGNWIQQIAAAVLMFELTRSAFMVGVVSATLFAGPLLLAFWTGMLTDRYDRRLLLMGARVVSGLASGLLGLAILVLGPGGFGGQAVLLLATAVMGVGHAMSAPAMQALTPSLVSEEELEQALALSSAAPSIARTVGPALGAGLMLVGGPGIAFAVAALTHWLFVAILAMISARRPARRTGRPDLFGGLRYLFHTRTAGLLILGIVLLSFGTDPVLTLSPSLADQLGGGSQLVGVFMLASGIGAVLTVVVFGRLHRVVSLRSMGVAGFLIVAAALVIVATIPTTASATIGFGINGAGFMLATVAINAQIQRHVPDELRGRVMALWTVAFLGARPIAAPVNGAIADLVSVHAAILLAAATVLMATALVRVHHDPTDQR